MVEIPSEYVVSVSCAAFFFVYADYLDIDLNESKISRFLQPLYLFLGVFSFVVLPVLLLTFPLKFDNLIQSSEVLSLVSLGFVLVIYNKKTKQSQNKFYSAIGNHFDKSDEGMERSKVMLNILELRIESLERENKELKSKIQEDKKILGK